MRFLFLSFSQLSPILPVSILVLSTGLLLAQRTVPLKEISGTPLNAPTPTQSAPVAAARTSLLLTYGSSPPSFEQHLVQTEPVMTLIPHPMIYDCPPININTAPDQAPRMAEYWGKERNSSPRDPNKRATFATSFGIHPETIYRIEDLEHYGRHIPWAGSIMVRVFQQAKAHPHVTSVLGMIKPRF